MSRGFEAYAYLISNDDSYVTYSYGCANWNDERYRNEDRIKDGIIQIAKSCFLEEFTSEMIYDGRIKVTNCSNCWQIIDDEPAIGIMAFKLLFKIFREYEKEGIQEKIIYYA